MKLYFKDFWYIFTDFFPSAFLAIIGAKNEILVAAEFNVNGWM